MALTDDMFDMEDNPFTSFEDFYSRVKNRILLLLENKQTTSHAH